MNGVVVVEGADLRILVRQLGLEHTENIHKISISTDSDLGHAKVKVNEGVWSPPLGRAL